MWTIGKFIIRQTGTGPKNIMRNTAVLKHMEKNSQIPIILRYTLAYIAVPIVND